MFNFNRAPKPDKSKDESTVQPEKTSQGAMKILEEIVAEAVENSPSKGKLSERDISVVSRYLALAQEKTGVAYTEDMLTNPHDAEGLQEEIEVALAERLSVSHEPTTSFVADSQGIVAPADSVVDAVHKMEEHREAA